MCNPARPVFSTPKSKTLFQFNQIVLRCLPHQATSVLHLLEPWIATILVTIVAVANVLRTSHSHVLILTQPLELDSGSQHFALQKAVAAKVSDGDSIAVSLFTTWETAMLSRKVEMNVLFFKHSLPQVMSPHQTTLATTQTIWRRQIRLRWRRDWSSHYNSLHLTFTNMYGIPPVATTT